MWVEEGLNKNPINDRTKSYWTESWIDELKHQLKQKTEHICAQYAE